MNNRTFLIGGVISIALLIIIGISLALSNPSIPQAQSTTITMNYFSYNCSQLETLVNQNLQSAGPMGVGTTGGYDEGTPSGYSVLASDYLQIMQLKACPMPYTP